MCVDEVPVQERESFRAFADLLASLLHHEFRTRLEVIKDTYHPFNPDSDTRSIVEPGPDERQAAQQRLVDELSALAEDANFERISVDDLGRAFAEESLMKVRLEADFDDFEQVVFYRRGEHTRHEEVKQFLGLRRRTLEFTTYGKVLVYVKFQDAAHFEAKGKKVDDLPFTPGSTIIKLFQNVPRADLEMLFPNAQVRMRPIDKLLIGVPAAVSGVIVVATKLIAALIPVLLLLGFWIGLRREPVQLNQGQLVALGAALMAFGGYVVRQFLRTAGGPLTAAELDSRIEDWFTRRWDASFDFEVDDGLAKLRRLRLVDDGGQGRLDAVRLDEAKRRLDEIWDDLFAYNAAPRAVET